MLLSFVAFALSASIAAAEPPTPIELVDLFERSCTEQTQSIHLKIDLVCSVCQFSIPGGEFSQETVILHQIWFVNRTVNRWRIMEQRDSNRPPVSADKHVRVTADPNNWLVDASHVSHNNSWHVLARTKADAGEWAMAPLTLNTACFMFGYVAMDNQQPLAQVLRASQLSILPDDRVGGRPCKVLESHGPYGDRKIWFDPELGFQIRKYEDIRSGNQFSNKRTIASSDGSSKGDFFPKLQLERLKLTYDEIEYKEIGGAYFLTGFTATKTYEYPDNAQMVIKDICRISDIDPNPSFSAKDFAVELDIPNGTPVKVLDVRGITHEWQNGEIVRVYSKPKYEARPRIAAGANPIWTGRMVFIAVNIALCFILGGYLLWRRLRGATQ
jgi:hypothetical protein